MRGGSTGRLDRLALRCAGEAAATRARSVADDADHVRQPGGAGQVALDDDTRFSRRHGLKVALAAVASASLGLSQTQPARALDRGQCFTWCQDAHQAALQRMLTSCDDVFAPAVMYEEPGWRRFKFLLMFPPRIAYTAAATSLTGLCYGKAQAEVRRAQDECYRRCENRQEPFPPSKAVPPPVPPAPSLNDPCAACAQVGGICCGSPEPGKPPCGCAGYIPADGSSPCARIGC